jgi:rubrerythrin
MPEENMQPLNRDVLVDKLCERLAVETAGVALYQALIAKLGDAEIAPRLQHFMHEEAKHRDLLAAYLDKMGVRERGTPSAQLARLEGQAYLTLAGEATTPSQLLHILFTVELMDENAWEMLIDLGHDLDDEEMVRTFAQALKEEKEHLRGVRGMLAQLTRQMMMQPATNQAPENR